MRHPYHWLVLRWQLKFNPVGLFHRINQLQWYREALLDWTDSLEINPGMRLLEVGCATGMLSRHLSETTSVVGVDRSSAMIDRAQQENADTSIRFTTGDICALPFSDQQFDCALAASLINVVDNPHRALTEMRRVVVNGGWVSVLVPDTTISDHKARALIASLGITGFSREALWAWHRMAPKMDANHLAEQFVTAGIVQPECKQHLNGMLLSMTGWVGSSPSTTGLRSRTFST